MKKSMIKYILSGLLFIAVMIRVFGGGDNQPEQTSLKVKSDTSAGLVPQVIRGTWQKNDETREFKANTMILKVPFIKKGMVSFVKEVKPNGDNQFILTMQEYENVPASRSRVMVTANQDSIIWAPMEKGVRLSTWQRLN